MLKIQDNMIIKWRDDFDGSMLDRIGTRRGPRKQPE